jgi:hypothetical protein
MLKMKLFKLPNRTLHPDGFNFQSINLSIDLSLPPSIGSMQPPRFTLGLSSSFLSSLLDPQSLTCKTVRRETRR